ncbi:MAG: AraC family transcriptional regulator [Methyloceanibacter sp.]|uniref:AraC family transcriptional regulator n=1 Tax=Methyloceanibacter sp. TaxID=1965321 RepID=UPI003D6D7303
MAKPGDKPEPGVDGGAADGQAAPEPPPGRFVFSTEAFPEHDRFTAFREAFVLPYFNSDIVNRSDRPFGARVEGVAAGGVHISRMACTPVTYVRTRVDVERSDGAPSFYMGVGGNYRIEQGETSRAMDPGVGFLAPVGDPAFCHVLGKSQGLALKFAPGVLERLVPRELKPQSLSADLPAMRLVKSYLDSFEPLEATADPALLEVFGTHICDLIALAVGTSGDALELIGGRGLKAARTDAVLTAISKHFASPGLSAEQVAHEIGVSARQVHRLLEETPKTFYEHVLECRLQCAYRMLTSPRFGRFKVAEIAQRTGFTNVSHFNRLFRTRFGETPASVRASETAAYEHNSGALSRDLSHK